MKDHEFLIPTIEHFSDLQLVGLSLEVSVAHNTTGLLWSRFGPRIKDIENKTANYKLSLQEYPIDYFKEFSPDKSFIKWALVPVSDLSSIPEGLASFTLKKGLYAVFKYKGPSNDPSIFQYIFSKWLPNSEYVLDNRPHFELLGEQYKNNDAHSEEKIYIPVKPK